MDYDDRPIRQTHPSLLARTARRWSLQPAVVDDARVLEVGCAHGVNLMAMAARHPNASFVGFDLDEDAIKVARSRANEAALRNVRFEVDDVRTFDREPGAFDYAIAHGVLSWVSEEVGDALFALFARTLSPHGIGYVSYDAKPGACLRDAIGLGLRAASDLDAALDLLRGSPPLAGTLQGTWLDTEVEAARGQSTAFLRQQFLSPHQRAFSVTEVWDWAARHGLRYVDDVAETGLPEAALQATMASAAELTSDRRGAEQLFDVAILRQFRATVFARQPVGPWTDVTEPRAPGAASLPQRPRVSALTRIEARDLGFVSTADHDHRALHPLHALLIDHLDGTRTLPMLAKVVVDAVSDGALELPSASGAPATLAEVEQGALPLVLAALRDLAEVGLVPE